MLIPRTMSHIGVTVTDLDGAVAFYRDVFGCYVIMPPTEIVETAGDAETPISAMCRDVFGEGWQRFRIAHLSFGDRVGLELFEFLNTERRAENFEFWKTGTTHFCIQDADPEAAILRIEAHGGKRRMPSPRFYYPGSKPYRMIYAEDPFGNVLEIYSHSYELTYSAGAYGEAPAPGA